MKKLSKVFGSFEATHERSADLEKLYQALLTIAPTSVSSERAFSIAGRQHVLSAKLFCKQ